MMQDVPSKGLWVYESSRVAEEILRRTRVNRRLELAVWAISVLAGFSVGVLLMTIVHHKDVVEKLDDMCAFAQMATEAMRLDRVEIVITRQASAEREEAHIRVACGAVVSPLPVQGK